MAGWRAFRAGMMEELADPGPAAPEPPPAAQKQEDDPRARRWDPYYDLDLLAGRPRRYPSPQQDMGVLRTRWQVKFQRDGNGDWNYVEYVPAWTDPDWDERFFTYIPGAERPDDDDGDGVATRQYAKPGLLQGQRPALRPDDARRRPTEAARRWGFYPWRRGGQGEGGEGEGSPDGRSGVTPWAFLFPDIPLRIPQVTARRQGVQDHVNMADLMAEQRRWEEDCRRTNQEPTDVRFQQVLEQVANDHSDPANADMARALLQLLDCEMRREDKEEYQRLLYSGSTSDEVRISVALGCFKYKEKGD